MRDKADVVIVGAGPAGLTAAKILAEDEKKVLVLEKLEENGKNFILVLNLHDFFYHLINFFLQSHKVFQLFVIPLFTPNFF